MAVRQTLAMLCLLGGTGTVGYMAGPGLVEASDSVRQERSARRAALAMMLDAVAASINRSRAVLAVHPRAETPYVDVVLWMHDDRNPGCVDADEVALVSHSRALRSIRLFMLDPGRPASPVAATERPGAMMAGDGSTMVQSPRFGDLWRSDPRVASVILADGVSDLSIEIIRSDDGGYGAMRIELIWASESADWAERASVVVRLPSES